MKSLDISEHLIKTYLSLLKNLNNSSKLELISALSLSMKHKQQKQGELAQHLIGDKLVMKIRSLTATNFGLKSNFL